MPSLKHSLVIFLAASISAQGVNCALLASRNPLPGATAGNNNYAGMWGLVSGGRELAILPARSGTYVYGVYVLKNTKETR